MGLTIADAYTQIKNLENSGQITLPQTQDTVTVGTIDPKAGTFTWTVPTLVQTLVIPPGPGGKTNTIINTTIGVVGTKAVDLLLKFAVIPQQTVLTNEPLARMAVPAPAPVATPSPATAAAALKVTGVGIGIGTTLENNGGTTISGFPTTVSAADHIIVDAGLVCSTVLQEARNMEPPVSTFMLTINIPGHPAISVPIFILRPPVVGMGAFTLPALPMTIVYAPPQGKLLKNTASYSDSASITRTVTNSVSSGTTTKTVQAYTAADLIGKVAGAIAAVAAVVGTGGAGAAGGASVAGALSELGTALFGAAKDTNDSTADATKQITSELGLVSTVLNSVDSMTPSDSSALTVQTDQSLTLTVTNVNQWPSETALGPGVGDRIVYLTNVKVVWAAVNGEVGIHVLGFDGFGANSVQDLQQEQQSLAGGNPPRLNLDADTIKSLLSQDPLVSSPRRVVIGHFGAPVVGPPRFVPANPPGRTGTGTGSGAPDVFQAVFDATTDTKQTTTSSQTNITDVKPGWVSVLFGADNTETTTTSVLTSTQSIDDKTEDKVTSTISLFSEGDDDRYDVKIFYDNTFGTYAILDSNSPLLQGISVVLQPVALEPESTH